MPFTTSTTCSRSVLAFNFQDVLASLERGFVGHELHFVLLTAYLRHQYCHLLLIRDLCMLLGAANSHRRQPLVLRFYDKNRNIRGTRRRTALRRETIVAYHQK